jgi:hypothetical protein
VDLVEGGHLKLMFTDKEKEEAEADVAAAREAGVDLSSVEWFNRGEMKSVRVLEGLLYSHLIFAKDLRYLISSYPISRSQRLASQISHPTLPPCQKVTDNIS